jgi:hypothetical protein
MTDRDFKLLVRAYFNARDVAGSRAFTNHDVSIQVEAVMREAETEKQIRKELEIFTKEEQEELYKKQIE